MSVDKERIFIKRIDINNVGRFYGSHSITLSDSFDKNITIVIGLSGLGKSTIHNLIYWGLYGEHKNSDGLENIDYGLINIDALQNLSTGGNVTASVTLHLHNDKERKYLLTRKLTATCNRDSAKQRFEPQNNSRVMAGFDFETTVKLVYKDDDGNMDVIKDNIMIKNEINKYFPQHLSDFFLFDGENLIKFQNNTSSDFIKNGITKISGLGILDHLSSSALHTAKEISKHIGGKSAEAAPYEANVNRLTQNKVDLESIIKKHEKKLDEAKTMYDEITKKITQNKSGADLKKRLDKTRTNRKNALMDRKKNNETMKDMLFEKIPQILLRNTLQKSENIFARLEDEDKIPPSISRGALDKILGTVPLRCVCGREFGKNDEPNSPWMTLNRIKDTIIEDGLSQGISLGRDLISRIIDLGSIEKSREEYDECVIIRHNKNKEVREYDASIDDLETQISEIRYDDDQDLGKRHIEQWTKITRHNSEIAMKKQELDDLNISLREATTQLDGALEKEGKYKNEINKKHLATAVSVFAKNLEKRIEEILRNKTEKETSKYFLESAPESQTFDHVSISRDYDITVKDSSGLNSDLSKGQAHVLGLSYVAGIRKITHTDTFLIIDSPLHNISGKARNLISEVFSRYLPGVQIVLLVTDTEYTYGDDKGAEPVKNILRKNGRIWKEYSIEATKDNEIESRSIVEHTK